MNKVPMTTAGYERMQEELKQLRTVQRPGVISALADAREHGDLSENAEYHAARDRQSFIEGRIAELEDMTKRAEVIDVARLSGDVIRFGATVTLTDEESHKKFTYQIVGEIEADVSEGRLAVTSPVARAIIGRRKGDSVEVESPRGSRYYEIKRVAFK